MLSSVNFDLYFSFWRWSSVNYSKQNTENDWKLPGQALFIVRWLERNWPLHWKIPKCLCLLSGGCSFSLEKNPYIPIFLNYWRRTWKENLERVSHPLLSDLNLIYLFMALFSSIPVSLIPKYLLADFPRDWPYSPLPDGAPRWLWAWGWGPQCLATLFRFSAQSLICILSTDPSPLPSLIKPQGFSGTNELFKLFDQLNQLLLIHLLSFFQTPFCYRLFLLCSFLLFSHSEHLPFYSLSIILDEF